MPIRVIGMRLRIDNDTNRQRREFLDGVGNLMAVNCRLASVDEYDSFCR
jgi:hypothetical protein